MNIKTFIALCFFFFVFIQPTIAQVGVGITTYRVVLEGKIGQEYIQSIGIMNPSQYTTTVKVGFECLNCVEEVKIFGVKLFEKIEKPTEYFVLEKDMVQVPGYTSEHEAVHVKITFKPKLIIFKEAKFYTPDWLNFFIQYVNPNYDGSFTIPYITLLIGKKQIEGKVAADVIGYDGGALGVMPSVAATLTMTAYGMPLGSFIFLVFIILVLISLIIYKNRKRLYGFVGKLIKRKKHTQTS